MQSYSAPLNDMKFIIEDFLNSGAEDTLFKQNDIEIEDFNFILDESSKFCEEILCLLYTSPSPRDTIRSRMPSSA